MSTLPAPSIKKSANALFVALLFIVLSLVTAGCSLQDSQQAESSRGTNLMVAANTNPSILRTSSDTLKENTQNLENLTTEEIVREMSLREKIGQLFFVRARGYFKNEHTEEYKELAKKIDDFKVGGIIFFDGTVYGQAVLTNDLQQKSTVPLWITQDMEFGAAMRIEGTTRITPAMGIAASGNANNAYWAGKITAQEAKILGVNQIFAPVLDVNNNPKNPVINIRSFSGDPGIVADFGTRFIDGVSSEDVISTAKHFPGHGDTDTDSHYRLPVINADYARLDSIELVPFKAAIQKNVGSVMSAHINFPKIGSTPGRPSTLDRSILNRILVDSLGFNGMIVTDGLEMSGISSHYSPGEAVVLALQAGADIMLLTPDELEAIEKVEEAVRSGRLSEQRIDNSVRKLIRWKKQAGLFEDASVKIDQLNKVVSSPQNKYLADQIARESITMLKNESNIIPINPRRFPRILVLSVANDNSGNTGRYLARQMRQYHPAVRFEVFDDRTNDEEERSILRDARWADLIVLGSYINVDSQDEKQFSDRQMEFLNKLSTRTPKILLTFDNPYAVQDLPNTEVQIIAWDDTDQQIANTVPALLGKSAISSKLPIEIPGMYELGHGLSQPRATECFDDPASAGLSPDSLQKVETIMQDAITDSTFPGGVVGVVKNGRLAYCHASGYHTYDKSVEVAPNDVYDLASLTKVVATTTSVMKLVDEGKVDLDDRVSEYFPEFSNGEKTEITLQQLLLHTSGLPAFRVYVDSLQTRDEILNAVKNEPLINKPGEKYVYSDLGFILLARIVEQVSGQRIDEYTRRNFYEPLHMESTFFNPKSVGASLTERIPPTEIDETYRHKLIHAEVNDERAWYLEGVAGHAGLFSNIQDLSVYAQLLLSKGSYAGKQYISPEIIEQFTSRQSNINQRGLGFDRKSPSGFSTAGSLTSDQTFGHLGFTGTSIWIDPANDMAIILLTNRTYPKRSYGKNISKVRAAIADAVMASITAE